MPIPTEPGLDMCDYAQDIAQRFGLPVACERYRHPACGDDPDRWHWCFRVTIAGKEVITGRKAEILRFLDGMIVGMDAARHGLITAGE